MTVGGLWDWLKKKSQIDVEVLRPSKIRDKIIPIDILGLMYSYRFGPRKAEYGKINPFKQDVDELAVDRHWFGMVIKRVVNWVTNFKFIPLFVYDGAPRPLRLQVELQRRKVNDNTKLKKIQELKSKYAKTRPIAIPEEARAELRKLMAGYKLVPRESAARFKAFFSALGIPTITVDGDAERFCALFSSRYKVPVISKDGDCFAHGANSVIVGETTYKEPGSPYCESTFEIVRTNKILAKLDLDYDSFVDLCIFSGTDYNLNIKNKSFLKGIPLIQQYRYLENFPDDIDVDQLNYLEVRKEFEQVLAESLITEGQIKSVFDLEIATAALEEHGLEVWLDDVVNAQNVLSVCSA